MMRKISVVVGVLCLLWSAAALAETVGWRGDGTGRFPNADPPTEWAKDKNIVWASKMPAWSNSSPILVGDKLFVCSEPTDLVCCNAADGKILWKKSHEYFDALSPAELPKAQEIKKQADEITKQLEATRTELFARGAELNKNPGNADLKKKADDLHAQVINIMAKLVPVSQYSLPPAHPDTGYATPTPVSDGKNVYVLAGNGVAACYDLNGNRKWIKIVTKPKSDVGHSASPLLFGDKFIYHIGVPTALNKDTGEELWKGDSPSQCGTPAIARIKGVDALVTPWGNVVRISDGKTLAYFGRGLAYGHKGEHDRAIQDFNEALALNSSDATTYYMLGLAYYSKGEYDRAIQDLDEALELNPNEAGAYYKRGLAYASKGDYDKTWAERSSGHGGWVPRLMQGPVRP